jgi:hypothetical protein
VKRVAAALLWFSLAAALGYWVGASWLPGRLQGAIEAALGEALASPVRVAEVRVRLRADASIEVREFEAWPDEGGPALRASAARLDLDGLALLVGVVRLDALRIEGATLRVTRGADGSLAPAPLVALVRGAGEPASGVGGGWAARLGPLAGSRLVLELGGARVSWRDLAGPGLPIERSLDVPRARLALGRAGAVDLALDAHVSDASGRARGGLALSATRESGAAPHAVVTATQLDLDALEPYLGRVLPLGLRGRVTGSLDVSAPELGDAGARAPSALELDLHVAGLRVAPAGEERRPFETRAASLRASALVGSGRVELRRGDLVTDQDTLSITGALPWPLRDEGVAELSLELPRLTLARAREIAEHLPRDARRASLETLAPIEAGEIARLAVRGSAPVARWRELVDPARTSFPTELAVEAEVRGIAVRTTPDDRLDGVSGSLRFESDRLELRGVRGHLNGRPLPALDASFAGVSRILAGERFAAHPPTPEGLPGLRPLQKFLSRRPDDPDRTPRWTRLRVDADFLHHPALLLPLEDAHAEIAPTRDGVHWIVERALFGGVPIDAEGDYFDAPEDRVVVSVRAVGERGPRPAIEPGGDWGRARFGFVLADRPGACCSGAAGWARLRGGTLRLFDAEVWLRGDGVLRGDADFELSAADGVPYDARLSLAQPNAGDLALMFGAEPDLLTGRLDATGRLAGRLVAGRSLLDGAEGSAHAFAQDGDLRQRLPLFVAIASVSETLNPFAKRDRIRYRSAEGDLVLAQGRLSSEAITVDSPDLRLFLSGLVGIAAPHDTQAVVGLFFLGKVSSMIGLVPIVNRVLLGENENLAGAYFELAGPWSEPRARLVPLKSLAETGPASFVLEGLPSFVRSGIEAIESVLGGRRRDEDEATPSPERPAAPGPLAPPEAPPVGATP